MKVKKLMEYLDKLDDESQIVAFDTQEDQFYKITEILIELGPHKYYIGIKKTETAEWT